MPSPAKKKEDTRGRVIHEGLYKRLYDAYLEFPEKHLKVAAITGLAYGTCKKAWEVGLKYPYAIVPIKQRYLEKVGALQGIAQWATQPGPAGGSEPAEAPDQKQPQPSAAIDLSSGISADVARSIVSKLAGVRAAELSLLDEARENAHAIQVALGHSRPELVAIGKRIKVELGRIARGEKTPEGESFDLKEAIGALKAFSLLGKVGAQQVKLVLEGERIVLNDLTGYIDSFAPKPGEGGAGGDGGQGGGDETSDEELVAELERDAAAGGSARHLARIRGRAAGLEVIEGGAGQPAGEEPQQDAAEQSEPHGEPDEADASPDEPEEPPAP